MVMTRASTSNVVSPGISKRNRTTHDGTHNGSVEEDDEQNDDARSHGVKAYADKMERVMTRVGTRKSVMARAERLGERRDPV